AEKARIETIGEVGGQSLEIRFVVDRSNVPQYEQALARSITEARAQTVAQMYDALRDEAKGLPGFAEQAVAYGLLGLTPAQEADLRMDVKMNLSDDAVHSLEHYRLAGYASFDQYVRGSATSPINGGLFDIDALLHVDQP